MHAFSPSGWLVLVLASAILAVGSALVLTTRVNASYGEAAGRLYDAVELFWRDTVRLTFKDRVAGDSADAVFVAPKGILQKDSTFKWLEESPQDSAPQVEAVLQVPAAPSRVLDPDWAPAFFGLPHDKNIQ